LRFGAPYSGDKKIVISVFSIGKYEFASFQPNTVTYLKYDPASANCCVATEMLKGMNENDV
jgi:hypothetical protein